MNQGCTFLVRSAKNIVLVCHGILVISVHVPLDKKRLKIAVLKCFNTEEA